MAWIWLWLGIEELINSLSSNLIKAVKGVRHLCREIEGLSLPFSCYCFGRYAFLAVQKKVYVHRGRKRR